MSLFHSWLEKRNLKEEMEDGTNPVDQFKFNNDKDYADDNEQVQRELFSSVLSKYPEETMQFLYGIAQRGDEEIAALVRKLDREGQPSYHQEPKHPTDTDEVVPPNADSGSGGGDEGGLD